MTQPDLPTSLRAEAQRDLDDAVRRYLDCPSWRVIHKATLRRLAVTTTHYLIGWDQGVAKANGRPVPPTKSRQRVPRRRQV